MLCKFYNLIQGKRNLFIEIKNLDELSEFLKKLNGDELSVKLKKLILYFNDRQN